MMNLNDAPGYLPVDDKGCVELENIPLNGSGLVSFLDELLLDFESYPTQKQYQCQRLLNLIQSKVDRFRSSVITEHSSQGVLFSGEEYYDYEPDCDLDEENFYQFID